MPLAADAFQPFVVRGLSPVRRQRAGFALSDVVINATAGYDLSVIDSSQSVVLDSESLHSSQRRLQQIARAFLAQRFKQCLKSAAT